tara:strand:- start:2145 stop:2489 length:345 start_codon:yes stop_codon:yes gene_type:complete
MSQLIVTTSQTIENGNTTFLESITISSDPTERQRGILNIPAGGQENIRWDEVDTPVVLIIDSPIILNCTLVMSPGSVNGINIKKITWEGNGFIELIMNNATASDVLVRYEVYGS